MKIKCSVALTIQSSSSAEKAEWLLDIENENETWIKIINKIRPDIEKIISMKLILNGKMINIKSGNDKAFLSLPPGEKIDSTITKAAKLMIQVSLSSSAGKSTTATQQASSASKLMADEATKVTESTLLSASASSATIKEAEDVLLDGNLWIDCGSFKTQMSIIDGVTTWKQVKDHISKGRGLYHKIIYAGKLYDTSHDGKAIEINPSDAKRRRIKVKVLLSDKGHEEEDTQTLLDDLEIRANDLADDLKELLQSYKHRTVSKAEYNIRLKDLKEQALYIQNGLATYSMFPSRANAIQSVLDTIFKQATYEA